MRRRGGQMKNPDKTHNNDGEGASHSAVAGPPLLPSVQPGEPDKAVRPFRQQLILPLSLSLVVCEGFAAWVIHDQSWSWQFDLLIFGLVTLLAFAMAAWQAAKEMWHEEREEATRQTAASSLAESV